MKKKNRKCPFLYWLSIKRQKIGYIQQKIAYLAAEPLQNFKKVNSKFFLNISDFFILYLEWGILFTKNSLEKMGTGNYEEPKAGKSQKWM